MALPGVNITIENGQLGRTLTLNDGVTGIVATATAVAGKMAIGTAYAVTALRDAEQALGITADNNALLHGIIADYYTTLGGNTTLYILPVATATTMEAMLDADNVEKLQAKARGSIRLIGVSQAATTGTVTLADGVDADVDKAVINGQATATVFAAKMQPFRVVIDAKNFNGSATDLKDYNTATYNRCSLFLAGDKDGNNNRIGLLLGALSAQPVERKVSRVRNGPLPITGELYIGPNKTAEGVEGSWDVLHDRGYIFPRTFVGKSGYFLSSDRTATSSADDFSSLARGRVIDKAMLIAYSVYVDRLDDEVQLNDDGTMLAPVVTEMEGTIENAITANMLTAISAVEAVIPQDQNLLSDDTLRVSLRIVPVAYTSSIAVSLGFDNPLIN